MKQPSSLLPGPVLHPRSCGAERLAVDEVWRRSEVLSQGQDHRSGRCLVQLGRQVRSCENRFGIEDKDAAEPVGQLAQAIDRRRGWRQRRGQPIACCPAELADDDRRLAQEGVASSISRAGSSALR